MSIAELDDFDKRKWDGTSAALGHDSAGRALVDDIGDVVDKVNEVVGAMNDLDPTAAADGNVQKLVARATFDPSANTSERAIGAHGLGVTIPDNAVLTRSWYEVLTTFTSATDAATIALHANSANDIKSAVAISNGANPFDAGFVEGIQDGTAAAFVKLSAARELTATVAVEALTAGKLILFVEYVIGG